MHSVRATDGSVKFEISNLVTLYGIVLKTLWYSSRNDATIGRMLRLW